MNTSCEGLCCLLLGRGHLYLRPKLPSLVVLTKSGVAFPVSFLSRSTADIPRHAMAQCPCVCGLSPVIVASEL